MLPLAHRVSRAKAENGASVCETVALFTDGRRASAGASLAMGCPVRNGHRGFSLLGHKLAETDEKRGQEQQRNATADDPDGNLDRKRIRDADGVAKEVDQFFHVSPARRALKAKVQFNPRASCQKGGRRCERRRTPLPWQPRRVISASTLLRDRACICPLTTQSGHSNRTDHTCLFVDRLGRLVL